MPDCISLTVLIYDWPAETADAPAEVLAALEQGGLFTADEPDCSEARVDVLADGRRVLHLEDHMASGGLRQLERSGLEEALMAAGMTFEAYDEPDYASAGRIRDWRPGWEQVRERARDDGGALMNCYDLRTITAQAGSNRTALLAALHAFFADVTDEPEPVSPLTTPEETVEALGVKVTLTRSEGLDRAPVVYVDTDEALEGAPGSPGPRIRILLNEHEAYVGVPHGDPGDGPVTIAPASDRDRAALVAAVDGARDNVLGDRAVWDEDGIGGEALAAELAALAAEAERADCITIPAALVGAVAAQCDFSDTQSLDDDEAARAALLPLLTGDGAGEAAR